MAFKTVLSQEVDVDEAAMDAQAQPKSVNLSVSYNILEREGPVDVNQFIDLQRPASLTLDYKIENVDEEAIYSIVGVSGSVVTALDQREAGSLSAQTFEPIEVMPGKTDGLKQKVELTLAAGRYYVIPYVHIQEDGEVKRVMVSPFAIEMLEPPMSVFDFSFLSVVAMLAALIGGAFYIYTSSVAPAPKLKKKDAVPVKVDESWLPDIHKK